MNVVDTSGWIESIVDAPNADFFRPSIIASEELVVPTISIFEVYRVVLRLQGEESASESTGMMTLAQVVNLDTELAAAAARLAHEEKLAMADAIILATARRFNATLWTQDVDLKRFDNVKFRGKR